MDASYRFIQLSIGVMSFLFPIVTLGGAWISGRQHPDSISTTYYTHAHGMFVGGLCAIGFLFLAYQRRGFGSGAVSPDKAREFRVDQVLSIVSGVAATSLALVPTSNCENRLLGSQPVCPGWWTREWLPGVIHALATAVLMAAVATLCLRQFVRTNADAPAEPKGPLLARVCQRATHVPAPHQHVTAERLRANVVYRVCGIIIVVCVLCIVGLGIVDLVNQPQPLKREVSLVEGIAFWAFSVAWLTKSDYVQWKPWPRPIRHPADVKHSKPPPNLTDTP